MLLDDCNFWKLQLGNAHLYLKADIFFYHITVYISRSWFSFVGIWINFRWNRGENTPWAKMYSLMNCIMMIAFHKWRQSIKCSDNLARLIHLSTSDYSNKPRQCLLNREKRVVMRFRDMQCKSLTEFMLYWKNKIR